MDNWLIFQYCGKSELWGRVVKGRAGNEKTGASADLAGRQIPLRDEKRDAETEWSEASGSCAEKSRYCVYRTRTANRHR